VCPRAPRLRTAWCRSRMKVACRAEGGTVMRGTLIHSFHRISLPLPQTPSPSATTTVYQIGVARKDFERNSRQKRRSGKSHP